ncbi:MAG TPA: glycosyltransferase family A protein [Bryobacteraceae bacterium]|nr:glycosyltransferase family A protein [Bryobacteraceae bacterium]
MSNPPVSVIIPTYNRGEVLCETMAMALAQDYPDFEVIVVDQTPEPSAAVRAFVENAGSRLRYIRREVPNLPAARNAGVRISRGEIIVFMDDDVIVGPEYVAAHVHRYHDASVGGVMGITLAPGESDDAAVLTRDLATFGMREPLADGCFRVESLVGCNSSYRREAFFKAGWADERFGGLGYCEDTDLGLRIGRSGYKLVLDPRVRLVHLALQTGGCGFRDPAHDERVRGELNRLRLLLMVKHRATFGTSRMVSSIWTEYRGYALNRTTLTSPAALFRRHWRFLRGLCQAAWAAIEGPIVSQPEIPA